jgi:hypothetical protein
MGLLVVLDGDTENPAVTDEQGRFAFRDVSFGAHEIYVEAPSGGGTPASVLAPFSLLRTEAPEIHIAWPYDPGPEKGFLQVDVKREDAGSP